MRLGAVATYGVIILIAAAQFGCQDPVGPSSASTKADVLQLVTMESESAIVLGQVACAGIEVSQQYSNFLAWASTWKTSPLVTSLSLSGVGTFRQGWGFPVTFMLACGTTSASSCPDAESRPHTCDVEYNGMGLSTFHSATTATNVYTAQLSASDSCEPEPNGGGGGGGPTCESETLIIEVYNDDTGMWEYWGTETVLVCS